MSLRRGFAVVGAAAAIAAHSLPAQQIRRSALAPRPAREALSSAPRLAVSIFDPPARFVPRMNFYMNWGTAAGALGGWLYGLAVEEKDYERSVDILVDALVGAAIGNLAGAIPGMIDRTPRDTTRPISSAVRNSPSPLLAWRLERLGDYVGLAGRFGASIGGIGGAIGAKHDNVRGINIAAYGLTGWVTGMAVGAVVYEVRHGR
jgi:hypothetical protein